MSAILKHLEDLLRFNTTRNMRFNNQVHEFRKRDCNVRFHVFLVLKQMIFVFVSGCIASFTNRIPDGLLACVKAQAFNAFEKVGTCSTKMIAKTLKGNTKQDACRPRGIVKDLLGFVVWLLNQVGHVFGSGNTDGFRPLKLTVFHKTMTATLLTFTYAEIRPRKQLGEIHKANFMAVV